MYFINPVKAVLVLRETVSHEHEDKDGTKRAFKCTLTWVDLFLIDSGNDVCDF